jgi:putative peptide zinc metalloprotease protein
MSDLRTRARSWDDLRPLLGEQVEIDPPLSEGAPWIISVGGVPRARVGADFARMASSFDGTRSLHDAVVMAGVPVDDVQALQAVDTLASAGLLRALHRKPSRSGRFTYRRPLSFQWVLFDPTRVAQALARPFLTRIGRTAAAVLFVLVLLLAAWSAARHASLLASMLSGPVPLDLVLYLGVAIVAMGGVHEFGHAVALAAFGGRPTRMGVMLFYFTPAFFCDVTDGWRIRERARRVVVALAGPAMHTVVGGISLCLLSLISDRRLQEFLAVFALACFVSVASNLIPLIKLDGYLALMALTDTPNLRARAMATAGSALVRLLFGVESTEEKGRWPGVLAVYGALCWLFPVLLFAWAAYRLQPLLLDAGPWSAACYLLLVLGFLAGLVTRTVSSVAAALRRHPRWWRTGLGLLVTVACAAAVLLIPVRAVVHGGYVVVEGRPFLVTTTRTLLEGLDAGDAVRLRSNGVIATPVLAVGETGAPGEEARELDAPLAALAPVTAPDVIVPVFGIPLVVSGRVEDLPRAGAAEVDPGVSSPLGGRLVQFLVQEPVAAVLAGGGDRR